MNSTLERLKKNCRIPEADILADTKFFKPKEPVPTSVPMINVALSGRVNGGITPGLLILAGDSKTFKSTQALLQASTYMKKYEDAVLLFYDSEFGSPQAYFNSFGIDLNRVLHVPVKNIEELKFDIVNQLESITSKERVFIILDSFGNIASKKEVDDAINENSAADMSRAKALKGLWRMVTPYLTLKNIPMIAIGHTYDEQKMYGKQILSGGKGAYYGANAIWFIGRSQEKDGSELVGYNFNIKIEKSRFVREGSKIPLQVLFKGGISKWSGLLDVALELGYVKKPKVGWYVAHDPKTGNDLTCNLRAAQTNTSDFWNKLFKETDFANTIAEKYTLAGGSLLPEDISDEEIIEEYTELDNEK
jgi:RecA/RadA recombinase